MKLRAMMRTVGLLDSWNSSHLEQSDEDLAQKAIRAQGILPRTTERPARECVDEPRSNSVVINRYVPYPIRLERGECSGLPRRAAPQSHGRKSVVRGLLVFSCLFLASILYGCGDTFKSTAEINREFNRRAASNSYNNAHDDCWQIFSRVDPERNREYRECMSKKGWRD